MYGTEFEISQRATDGNYAAADGTVPDLIVLAEGANSSSRRRLGVDVIVTSPPRVEVVGEVHIELGGTMAKHLRTEPKAIGSKLFLTGLMTRGGSGRTWVVRWRPIRRFCIQIMQPIRASGGCV